MEFTDQQLANIEQSIEVAVNNYRRDVERIEKSDHPNYVGNKALREYEIEQIKKEFELEIALLRAKYQQTSTEVLKQYEGAAALSTHSVTSTDKTQVENALAEFRADYAMAYGPDDKQAAVTRLRTAVAHMTPGGMTHARQQLASVMPLVAEDKATAGELRGLNGVLAELKTPQQLQYEAVKQQTQSGGDITYRQLKITHKSYGNGDDNSFGAKSLEQLAAEESERSGHHVSNTRLL